MMQIYKVIVEVFEKPPIFYEPARQPLKAWVIYCLRDRGFKVIYDQNADFAIEQGRESNKLCFKVTDDPTDLDPKFAWIVWDSKNRTVSLTLPMVN
ncbi:hypothetical protein RINTHH_22340 [Richelia intracellularis HH01]|jgi:hypothetical protein|uniref:Uncharacterized protein n=1 Tax=Richelia intracellularis HH01 TaxID=1165094 RepID=M1WTU1_9NOST|nr:hypothetical protein [Richelia intracellularis]CCH68389.1 hypothetical protein RINTHH_22340 [Richelia intracellularis HH01]